MSAMIVDALGIKCFLFTFKLKRVSMRADLAWLLPYCRKAMVKAMVKGMGQESAQAMVERLKRMLN
jgi:hypothetical protein